jgi:hypothetical protein
MSTNPAIAGRGGVMAEKIIELADYKPHKVSEVICVKCGQRWQAVRPEETRLKDLECPKHHVGFVIETGEEIETA